MNITVIIVLLFGIFSIVGGIIGYSKAGSVPSLVAGSVSGIFLILSAFGLSRNYTAASYLALLVALLLGARFTMTIVKNFKVMPDLIMILFSAVTIIAVITYVIRK
jgi:uncharacterized membrane protein (UPF0136 family)